MKKTPNERQRQVIEDVQNNIILFASAGTGKTFTVANRVANILSRGLTTADKVLCLTFTIKACNELKEDILGYVAEANEVEVQTIHGFCYKILVEEGKRTGENSSFGICDEVDQEEILKSILSSRLSVWRAEKELRDCGITPPDFDERPVCKLVDDEAFYWLVEDKLVDCNGNVKSAPKQEEFVQTEAFCPVCGEITPIIERRCSRCGSAFLLAFAHKEFEIYKRRGALRNLISELKHRRCAQGYYSEDAEKDYADAFAHLKNEDEEKFKGFISYYAKYLGYTPDEDFCNAMEAFSGKLAAEYDEHLRLSNLLDFDDLILQTYALLQTEKGRVFWSTRYTHIVLDEMQDTSTLEYQVLSAIFAQNNVMLCGDFFQTIYGWRGSRPQEILEAYARTFSAKTYMLSENYRSTQTLAAATFGYLKNTYTELIGKYCPQELAVHSQTEGEKIFCYAFDNREQEARQIYRYLLKNKPQNPLDICIIARSNKYIAELSRFFERFDRESNGKDGLRFFTVEENFQFFKKPLVKDLLALFKLLLNPYDRVSMERLTEKFVKNVGIRTIETLRGYNDIGVSLPAFLEEQTYAQGDPYAALLEGYATNTLVIYDTETTGLDLTKDEAVQISAIRMGKDGIKQTLDILIEPTQAISKEAEKTHGFTLEYIREQGGVPAQKGLEQFSAFVQNCVLVGHNNFGYDRPLLCRQLKEQGLPPLKVHAEYDTLQIAKQFYPTLENFKLSTLCQRFSVVNACAHNALGDITATGECLAKMITESVLPTALARREMLAKYAPKFEKFFAFVEEMRCRLDGGEEFVDYAIERLLLKKRYPTHADFTTMRDLAESFQTAQTDKRAFLREYLQNAALSGSQMDVLVQRLNRIPVITVHQAKGCEFDTVILAGADDSNFPSFAAQQSGDEEEEKKVFYVALTRAKRRLLLTRALYNGKYELRETPYFWYIPEEYVRTNRAWKNGE